MAQLHATLLRWEGLFSGQLSTHPSQRHFESTIVCSIVCVSVQTSMSLVFSFCNLCICKRVLMNFCLVVARVIVCGFHCESSVVRWGASFCYSRVHGPFHMGINSHVFIFYIPSQIAVGWCVWQREQVGVRGSSPWRHIGCRYPAVPAFTSRRYTFDIHISLFLLDFQVHLFYFISEIVMLSLSLQQLLPVCQLFVFGNVGFWS
jgi:hypothetical protein